MCLQICCESILVCFSRSKSASMRCNYVQDVPCSTGIMSDYTVCAYCSSKGFQLRHNTLCWKKGILGMVHSEQETLSNLVLSQSSACLWLLKCETCPPLASLRLPLTLPAQSPSISRFPHLLCSLLLPFSAGSWPQTARRLRGESLGRKKG